MANPPFALLPCHFLFLVYYTLFLTVWEISYDLKKPDKTAGISTCHLIQLLFPSNNEPSDEHNEYTTFRVHRQYRLFLEFPQFYPQLHVLLQITFKNTQNIRNPFLLCSKIKVSNQNDTKQKSGGFPMLNSTSNTYTLKREILTFSNKISRLMLEYK